LIGIDAERRDRQTEETESGPDKDKETERQRGPEESRPH
jgi:hypothetical protein